MSRKKVVSRGEYIIKRVLIVIGCVLAVGVILGVTAKIVTIIGKNKLAGNANTEGPTMTEDADSELMSDPIYASNWQEGWVSLDGKIYEYNKDIRTFMVLGIDNAHGTKGTEYEELINGGQSDAIFLVILNPLDESIKILAVNRDTDVPVKMVGMLEGGGDAIDYAPIAIQHSYGGGGEYSCELTRDAVSKLLYNMPIHGYMSVKYTAVPSINDAVGGVTLTLPADMDVSAVNKSWKPGATVTLKGRDAYDFIHYRSTDEFESQRKRLERQKLYLKTFIKQMKDQTKQDIKLPVTLYNSIKGDIVSDITVDEIGYMASEYSGYSFNGDDIYTMEGETQVQDDGYEHFYPYEDMLRELVIRLFYKEVEL